MVILKGDEMFVASWNVLADKWFLDPQGRYGDYSYVDAKLREIGARKPLILEQIRTIANMDTRVFALQEVDKNLLRALQYSGWQVFPSFVAGKSVGTAVLVKAGFSTDNAEWPWLNAQVVTFGGVAFVNAHIQYAPADTPDHPGVKQTADILRMVGNQMPTVFMADTNDRPGGPVRTLLAQNGFEGTDADRPTAYVNGEQVALDLIVGRNAYVCRVETNLSTRCIPTQWVPSDHAPLLSEVDMPNR